MGYWNGYENYFEFAESKGIMIKCAHCGEIVQPHSPSQKYCQREDNPECDDDRYFKSLWQKGKHPLQLVPACL